MCTSRPRWTTTVACWGPRRSTTTPDGYRALAEWLVSFGEVVLVGVEGTGSYGTGLTRHLQAVGIAVVEVDRPNRQRRRRAGKSDTHDAVSAARAAFAGDALGAPKTRDGNVEAIRVLRVGSQQRQSGPHPGVEPDARADHDRSRRAPPPAPRVDDPETASRRGRVSSRGRTDVTSRELVSRSRPSPAESSNSTTRSPCSTRVLAPLVAETAPEMIERLGVGTDTAGALLVAAGENSDRIRNERSFARLCGAAPLDASSGKQQRHRLSRAGDRQANSALWRIVITRLSYDPATRRLPPTPLRRRQNQSRSHPLPQALRRTRALRLPPQRTLA